MHKLTFNMIDNKLYKEIEEYCNINNISDVKKEINKILKIGFNVVKYGVSPFSFINEKKLTEYVKENPLKENDDIKEEPVIETVEKQPKKKIRIVKNE